MFIGGRGSGKSAGIEALAYLCDPKQYEIEAKSKINSDWYSRAKATLAGCHVRIIWKTTSPTGIGTLPKKSLVVSRYFDPDESHSNSEVRDVDDQAIVDSLIKPPKVRILRVHEIENAAQSSNLRLLFDDLCGEAIPKLNNEIASSRKRLEFQRANVLAIVDQLVMLTEPGTPVRQYGIRKQQFEQVNKEDLRKQYEAYDLAIEVGQQCEKASASWLELGIADVVKQTSKDLSDYFRLASESIPKTDGDVAAGYKDLYCLLAVDEDTDDSAENMSIANRLQDSLNETSKLVELFENKLTECVEESLGNSVSLGNELVKVGLPAASGARSAKKKAFDKACIDLAEYESLLIRLEEALIDRELLRQDLSSLVSKRTEVRKNESERITAELRRDLDPSLLSIEIGAKSMFDRSEFAVWLDGKFGRFLNRSKAIRINAILESGILPGSLRDILIEVENQQTTILANDIAKVDDGKIDSKTSEEIIGSCKGRVLEALDESDQWSEEFIAKLPRSIRHGVVTFPVPVSGETNTCFGHVLELDELVLDDDTEIYLNDRPGDAESQPRPLSELSPGQRCSAILPIMLLSGDCPLIIDQPEENLDNRLVRQVIVNILAGMKMRRQIIIATHNPNLPVLGDAEQCVVLQARGKNLSEVVATGNLDSPAVANYVTDIMEGGREAFQYRQSIYQYHWKGFVENEQGA